MNLRESGVGWIGPLLQTNTVVAQGGWFCSMHTLPVGATAPENKNTPLVSQLGVK